MENPSVKFASQQEASAQLAEKIQGANPQPEAVPPVSQELQEADKDHDKALKILGGVAVGRHEEHADMNGNILNEKDQEELREKGPVGVK